MHQIEDGFPRLALRFRNRLASKDAVVGVDAILQAGVGLNRGLGAQRCQPQHIREGGVGEGEG